MFGKRLKDLREDKDLLQKDLAKVLGVTDRAIGLYEQGRREPDFETLGKLADFFNVSIDYLLGRTEYKSAKVITQEIDGHIYELDVPKDEFPNGLTKEEVIQILEGLKKAGLLKENNQ